MEERFRESISLIKRIYASIVNWMSKRWRGKIRPYVVNAASKVKVWWHKRFIPTIKSLPRRFLSLFAENIYGSWLLRSWASRLGYVLLFSTSFVSIAVADQHPFTRQFIHSGDANEAIVGAFTVLLALLIPLAIALIQGDNSTAFARQTMVKTIIRFNNASFVLVLICISLFIPSGLHVGGDSLTIKSLYASVLACCAMFILASFYRSVRWLSDGSSYSSGLAGDPPQDDPQQGAFSSYRFAWIVRLLRGEKSYQTWTELWSQWFPVGYEDTLHQAFFDRQFSRLNEKKEKQYIIMSIELEAYDKNFNKRNQDSWQFEFANPEKFFNLHAKIEDTLRSGRKKLSPVSGLYRGDKAVDNINNKIIDALMTDQRAWSLFDAMNKYLQARDLIEIGDKDKVTQDSLLKEFLGKFFDGILGRKLDTYHVESYFAEDSAWSVTYDHLYDNKKRLNLSFLIEDAFRSWLFEKLDRLGKDQAMYEVDNLLAMIFPETDPIIMGRLYWLLYKGQHTDNLAKAWYEDQRPFGHIGRSTGFYPVKNKESEEKMIRDFYSTQAGSTIKLFCWMYPRYLRSDFFDLAQVLETAKSIDQTRLEDYQVARINELVNLVGEIIKFYKKVDKDAPPNDGKKKKAK